MLSSSHPLQHIHLVEVSRSLALFSVQIKGRRCCSAVRGSCTPNPLPAHRRHRPSPTTTMSRCSRSVGSGRAGSNFGSSSVALPRNRRSSSAASCHRGGAGGYRGGAVGYRSLGCSSSRSLDGSARSRPTGAAGRCSPPRCGYGCGAAGAGFGCRGAGFGYRAGGASRPRTITPITINEQLLQPLRLELDGDVQAAKHREKEQIKTLNNKFASFIDKVS